ncbi:DUF3093 domain-containing protein [Mycobacterium sp.]|uniref:DUF3093 domain-containing protein n=1 Tax=Mycobacterium sp. TaxID=1785 RepID=UPI0031E09C45
MVGRRSRSGDDPGVAAATQTEPARLFYEPGASWYWVLAGPVSAVSMLLIEKSSGYGWQVGVPLAFLVLVSAFVGVQVKAARIHTSVELTGQSLRQGTETILVAEILQVYPDAEHPEGSDGERARWQSARALGELVGVPRGRVGIGLRLTYGRTAQAWARRHRHLRAALTPLVAERGGPAAAPEANSDDGSCR